MQFTTSPNVECRVCSSYIEAGSPNAQRKNQNESGPIDGIGPVWRIETLPCRQTRIDEL